MQRRSMRLKYVQCPLYPSSLSIPVYVVDSTHAGYCGACSWLLVVLFWLEVYSGSGINNQGRQNHGDYGGGGTPSSYPTGAVTPLNLAPYQPWSSSSGIDNWLLCSILCQSPEHIDIPCIQHHRNGFGHWWWTTACTLLDLVSPTLTYILMNNWFDPPNLSLAPLSVLTMNLFLPTLLSTTDKRLHTCGYTDISFTWPTTKSTITRAELWFGMKNFCRLSIVRHYVLHLICRVVLIQLLQNDHNCLLTTL